MGGTRFPYIGDGEPIGREFIGRARQLRFLDEQFRHPQTKPLLIVGPKGVGKTALLLEYLRRTERKFKTLMIQRFDGAPDDVFWSALESARHVQEQVILTIDNFRPIDAGILNLAQGLLNSRRPYAVVVTGRKVAAKDLDVTMLALAGLSRPDAHELLRYLLNKLDIQQSLSERDIQLLEQRAEGNPRTLTTAAFLLQDHTVEQVLAKIDSGLGEFYYLVSIPNREINDVVAPKIVLANEALLQELKRHPEDLYRISSRKFEELIAELLDDMGWEVQLTPAVKDGGKDIIATMQTDLGEILCLVEAKHYRVDRPVQVSLVRQLFGTYADFGATSAMLVTTSSFTRGAREFQTKHRYQISLKEYNDVVEWIRRYRTC